jgi:hypothetical protein
LCWRSAVNLGGARVAHAEYFVFSQVFEKALSGGRRIYWKTNFSGTIRRISKFRQIARENGKRCVRAPKSPGLTFRYNPTAIYQSKR